MRQIIGIDCVARITRARAQRLRELGYSFACRYLVPAIYRKALTRTEAENCTEAGLRILCCWETSADRARGGERNGYDDGAQAARLARSMEIPAGAVIYFAVDYDARENDFRAIGAYLTAAQAQLRPEYQVGVYGSARVCDAMRALMPTCRGFWQCCAWSDGRVSNAAMVYQNHWQDSPAAKASSAALGFAVDLDECADMDAAGMWNYNTKKEDDMSDQEIYEAVMRYSATLEMPLATKAWAEKELAEAQALGITDGTRPMQLIPRYQAAIMAKRAVQAAISMIEPQDDRSASGLLTDD